VAALNSLKRERTAGVEPERRSLPRSVIGYLSGLGDGPSVETQRAAIAAYCAAAGVTIAGSFSDPMQGDRESLARLAERNHAEPSRLAWAEAVRLAKAARAAVLAFSRAAVPGDPPEDLELLVLCELGPVEPGAAWR